jgi:hypothetical protein
MKKIKMLSVTKLPSHLPSYNFGVGKVVFCVVGSVIY